MGSERPILVVVDAFPDPNLGLKCVGEEGKRVHAYPPPILTWHRKYLLSRDPKGEITWH
jgi:hypothetical protein